MKLLSLKISSEFRNLRGINLRFDSPDDTFVIIGNNGSGKTNILEALSCIFSVLLSHTQNFLFGFIIRYQINEDVFRVKYQQETNITEYQKNGVTVTENEMEFPNRIVFNYSGEDNRIWEDYYREPYEKYMNSVRTAVAPENLTMVYIDRTKWQFILLCMLASRQENTAFDKFLSEKLHIAPNGIDRIEMFLDEVTFSRWRVHNQITLFLNQLQSRLKPNGSLSNNIEDFNPNDDEARVLFYKYVGASQVVNLKIYYNRGVESAFLSEGEKKMMVILFILETIADERTLVLMDEPDSHIHISRKAELNDMFHQMEHRSAIITSHSPTLTASFEKNSKDSIIMLDRKVDGSAVVIDKKIVNLVEKLTDGIWTSQKQNLFLSSHDDILIVEGPTDEIFISAALNYFKDQGQYTDLAFEFIPCGGASNVKAFAQKFIPKEGQTVIGFFDGDNAGVNSMNIVVPQKSGMKEKWGISNFGRARKSGKTWFSFYPPYPRRNDKKNFNIEDYFTCSLFRKYILSFSSLDTIKGKEDLKDKLKEDCLKGRINVKYFKKFSTLFEHIKAIKEAERLGKTELK